jgi:Peptidase M60, enhancin and enhancin-like
VLGWGDSHEMGHNIQALHIDDSSGNRATGEVSNNIYPSHIIYAWNKTHTRGTRRTPARIVSRRTSWNRICSTKG